MKTRQKSEWFYFKKNLPLTLMALPGIILMILFKYLPLSGIVLAFKKYNIRKGIFGSEWNGLENFKFLFKTSDAWIITRNTICYNLIFIVLDLVVAVTVAIVLNELLNKRRAKLFQTIFMAPYFLSWVVVSFIAFAFLSVDNGLLNHILRFFGKDEVQWYTQKQYWPFILVFCQLWKTVGYSTVMYLGSLVGISNDYYEAAIMDGATKRHQGQNHVHDPVRLLTDMIDAGIRSGFLVSIFLFHGNSPFLTKNSPFLTEATALMRSSRVFRRMAVRTARCPCRSFAQ